MSADNVRETIAIFKRIVRLIETGNGGSNNKVVENYVLHADNAGPLRQNAGLAGGRDEALRGQTGSHGSLGRAHVVHIAHIRKMSFVDAIRSETGRQADGGQLS